MQAFVYGYDFILLYPVYSIMFLENGVSLSQLSILLATWSVTMIALEIPFGVIADRFSRKYVLLASTLFKALGFVIWILFPHFIGYAAGFVSWGIAAALKSGTFEAYIHDGLTSFGKESEYETVTSKISTVKSIVVASSLILGGWLSEYGYIYVELISLGSVVLAFVVLAFAPSYEITKSTGESNYLKQLWKTAKASFKFKNLLYLMLIYIVVFGMWGALDEYAPVFFSELGVANKYIGMIGFSSYVMYAVGSLLNSSKFVQNRVKESWLIGITFIVYLGLVMFKSIPFFILQVLVGILISILDLRMLAHMQKYYDSVSRATMTSINAMFVGVMDIGMVYLMGMLSDKYNVWMIMLVPAVLLGIGFVLSLVLNLEEEIED